MNQFKYLFLLAIAALAWTGCDKAEDIVTEGDLELDVNNLGNLGAEHVYQAWVMVNNQPVSVGRFTVDNDGDMSETEFDVDDDKLDQATSFFITIEGASENDNTPSDRRLLGGDISGSAANLSVAHVNGLGRDLTTAQGKYLLATPTDGMNTNELSGVWFNQPGAAGPALVLPALTEGWEYEGWVRINGKLVSTGKFASVTGADKSNQYSGTGAAPPFPGEDFLINAPSGLTFPTNLSGQELMITIEPVPDNDADDPFFLTPLRATIQTNASAATQYDLTNQAATNNPTGSVVINRE